MISDLVFRDNLLILVAIVFVALLLSVEIPYRYGARLAAVKSVEESSWNSVYTGLLALVAFMLALSYAQAQGRFDARRELVVKEANAIGTTWLRADQLSGPERARFRAILTAYAKARLRGYEHPANRAAMARMQNESSFEQSALWNIASGALRRKPSNLGVALLMQTLNDTIDVSGEQRTALSTHVPITIILLTFSLLVLGSLATGFSFARAGGRPGAFTAIYIVALTLVFEMVVDFDRPQTGFVRVDLTPLRAQVQSMAPISPPVR